MDRTLTRLAERRPADPARAGVARWAIFEGAIFEAFLERLAGAELHGSAPVDPRIVLQDALDELDLPQDVRDGVRAQLDRASLVHERAERRRRQLALLHADVPPGPTAQDIVDDIELTDDPFA